MQHHQKQQTGGTRGLLCGGHPTGLTSNEIDFINVSTTGNAADFGDLTTARMVGTASSRTRGLFWWIYHLQQ